MVATRRSIAAAQSDQTTATSSSPSATVDAMPAPVAPAVNKPGIKSAADSEVKAYYFLSHLKRLFAGRPAPRPGAETWNSLDGFRALLCLWMVAFHSFFYVLNFVDDTSLATISRHPSLLLLNLGFLPVDGFFVLTGFLIAYPLFKEEAKRWKLVKDEVKEEGSSANAVSTPSPWSFDLSTFYYRRMTRMIPSYILAIYFHCGIAFPGGFQHSMDVVRSVSMWNFFKRALGSTTPTVSNNCTPVNYFMNLTFMNHLMPFGGCMGWTWTFALQFNFYLFFPLAWKIVNWRVSKAYENYKKTKQQAAVNGTTGTAASSSSPLFRKPSDLLLPYLHFILIIHFFARIYAFFTTRYYDLEHEESVFLGFFWYSNTATRGATIIYGALAAYYTIHTNLVGWLRRQTTLVNVGWILAAGSILIQMIWNRVFFTGNMIETPGWSAMKYTQEIGGPDSLKMNPLEANVGAYLPHAVFHILFCVGSPVSSMMFTFLLVVIVNGIGSFGAKVQSALSLPFWFPLSTLSWWVYLLHPTLMQRTYISHIEWIGELPVDHVMWVYVNVALQLFLSFGGALIAYCTIEQPLEILLRKGEEVKKLTTTPTTGTDSTSATAVSSSTPALPRQSLFYTVLRRVLSYYAYFCMFYMILHHVFMYFAVSQLTRKEYIEKEDHVWGNLTPPMGGVAGVKL